jgi:hypothetical protein
MRLYYEKGQSGPYLADLCQLACQYDHLDLCNVESLPGMPMKNATNIFPKHWRAFPTLDAQVKILLKKLFIRQCRWKNALAYFASLQVQEGQKL